MQWKKKYRNWIDEVKLYSCENRWNCNCLINYRGFFILKLSDHFRYKNDADSSVLTLHKSCRNCRFGRIYWRNSKWKTSFFVQCKANLCILFELTIETESQTKQLQKIMFHDTLNSRAVVQPGFKSTPSGYCAKFWRWRYHYDADVIIVTLGKTWNSLCIVLSL